MLLENKGKGRYAGRGDALEGHHPERDILQPKKFPFKAGGGGRIKFKPRPGDKREAPLCTRTVLHRVTERKDPWGGTEKEAALSKKGQACPWGNRMEPLI